ncbi:hypothetical protein B0H21DRAFT_742878 [Amylocystis lapponica]|nr:hypothetical protein B0H21DRAFT_742878 [Amylocystis lapponica]
MFASALLLPLAAAATAFAAPTRLSTSESPSYCGRSFGPGAGNLAYNITLGALNTTGPVNYTDPGVPVVLSSVGSSGAGGVSSAALTTATSSGVLASAFSLINGSLIPDGVAGGMSAVNRNVSSGGMLGFAYAADPSQLPAAPEVYCTVADTDPAGGYFWPVMMVNGKSDFSLCPAANNVTTVVFEATSDNDGAYDYDNCYGIRLQQLYQQ